MRRIEAGNEPASARLARDYASGCVGVALRDGCCLSTSAVGASVNVADLHPSLLVNGHVKEVEQIAANIRATVAPDAAALHWVIGRYVVSCPVQSSVECAGNVKMPETTEAVRRAVARRR